MIRTLFLFLFLLTIAAPAFAADQEKSVYDRVKETKTLRCGYLPYEPFITINPNTGEIGGLTHDYLEAVAQRDGYKIEWSQDVNFDQVVPSIETNKIDLLCVPCTPDPNFSKLLDFPAFIGALPYYVYVPEKSAITEDQLKTANFATQDGYALTEITKTAFPEGKFTSLPQTSSTAEFYDQLKYSKVDAVINEHISAENYMRNNPDTIRHFSDKPVIAMRMFLVSKKNDEPMTKFLNDTFGTEKPENLELMRKILDEHKMPKGSLLLGEECAVPAISEKGQKICEQPSSQTEEKKD
ncbi:MAG TPA: transporter substrate-binding domain-containing protein [Alphaproteobacteria bacterium]|nr:transporter substrate-binding domain-containing protein [Alphaproteobacteria bacterium]